MAECTDEPPYHGKRMSSRQAMDTHESGACTKPKYHQPVPSQYRNGGPWVKSKKGYGLALERRGEPILEFPQILLGKMFCWDDIPSKRGKDELESLGACPER